MSNEKTPGVVRTAISASLYLAAIYLGQCITATPFTKLVTGRMCARLGLDAVHCHPEVDGIANPKYDDVQEQAAAFDASFFLIIGIPQLATCVLWGCIGDAYGRRITLICSCLSQVFYAASLMLPCSLNIILLAATASGFLGGNYTSSLVAFSAVADVTKQASPRDRALVFGIVEGAMFIAVLAGPVMGGVLFDNFGLIFTLGVATGINIVNAMITYVAFSETLEPQCREPVSLMRANPFAALVLFAKSRTTLLLVPITFSVLLVLSGSFDFLSLYALKVEDLTASALGLLQSINIGNSVIGLLIVMPIVSKFMSVRFLMVISCLNGVVCWMALSIVTTKTGLFAANIGLILPCCFLPIVRTIMANSFGSKHYGESLAAVGVLEQAATMLGPLVFDGIYSRTEATEFTLGGVTVRCIASVSAASLYLIAAVAGMLIKDIPLEFKSDEAVSDKTAKLLQ